MLDPFCSVSERPKNHQKEAEGLQEVSRWIRQATGRVRKEEKTKDIGLLILQEAGIESKNISVQLRMIYEWISYRFRFEPTASSCLQSSITLPFVKKKKTMSVEKSNERISSIKAVLARMLHFWKNNTEKAAAFGDGDNIWIYLYIWVVHIT